MIRKIIVAPAPTGWSVRSEGFENAMLFLSGAKAELAARQLAEHVATAGDHAEVEVRLRDGALAGRFVCSPVGREARGLRLAL